MKKEYFAPTVKVISVALPQIMAGSESAPDEWGDSTDLKFEEEEEQETSEF